MRQEVEACAAKGSGGASAGDLERGWAVAVVPIGISRANNLTISLLSLPRTAVAGAALPEIEILGQHSPSWMEALAPSAPVWPLLDGVATPARGGLGDGARRIVVPLMEAHIVAVPRGCHALVPSREALVTLADKARFARHAAEAGVVHLLPATIPLGWPTFPAMLKRTDLHSGLGTVPVTSLDDLRSKLVSPPWLGQRVLLQELIPARTDLVTHVVCVRGRIVWHQSYAYPLASDWQVRGPVEGQTMHPWRASPSDIRQFESLLEPLGFDGPANIDYRRRPDGSLAILEINPRLGGSLMRPDTVADLAGALAAIVRHATWRPTEADAPVGRLQGAGA